MYYSAQLPSPVGPLTLVGDGDSLAGLWIEGQKYFQATLRTAPQRRDDLPLFRQVKEWLERYFSAAVMLDGGKAAHGGLGVIERDDVVIAISKGGSSEELVRILPSIKEKGAKLIGVTEKPRLVGRPR